MAADPIFVDTNVLIYAHDRDNPGKQARALDILSGPDRDRLVWSAQVLGEFFHVATRKLQVPPAEARRLTEALGVRARISTDVTLVIEALAIHAAASLSYWDALIIAAGSRARATQLLSEDLNSGETIAGVEIVNPFA